MQDEIRSKVLQRDLIGRQVSESFFGANIYEPLERTGGENGRDRTEDGCLFLFFTRSKPGWVDDAVEVCCYFLDLVYPEYFLVLISVTFFFVCRIFNCRL